MSFRIRDFDPRRDKPAALSFILGSQRYERAFEPDRRVDDAVAGEHFAMLMKSVAESDGRIFIAEEGGRAVGWAIFVVVQGQIYVIEAERSYGYIAELVVDEPARSRGVGRALIAACEDEARGRRLSHVKIGLLTNNARTADIYPRAGYSPYASELRKRL